MFDLKNLTRHLYPTQRLFLSSTQSYIKGFSPRSLAAYAPIASAQIILLAGAGAAVLTVCPFPYTILYTQAYNSSPPSS